MHRIVRGGKIEPDALKWEDYVTLFTVFSVFSPEMLICYVASKGF